MDIVYIAESKNRIQYYCESWDFFFQEVLRIIMWKLFSLESNHIQQVIKDKTIMEIEVFKTLFITFMVGFHWKHKSL